jgi:hypothetical protein
MSTFRAFIDELTERFPTDFGKQLEELESKTESEIDGLLNGLSGDQLQGLLEIIRLRRGLIDTNAAYSNEVVSTSKQILAFGGAGIGLVAAAAPKFAELPTLFVRVLSLSALLYLNLTFVSFWTILRFVLVSRFRYPFLYLRKIANTISFFYYQAISPNVPRSVLQTAKQKYDAVVLYANDFVQFTKHLIPGHPKSVPITGYPQVEQLEASIEAGQADLRPLRKVGRDELQQYFLLISYQGYVNQFEVRMNNGFFYGVIASIISTILIAAYLLAFK